MIMRRGKRRMAAVRTLLAGVLLAMTLAMNAIAIWIRYRFRKKINW